MNKKDRIKITKKNETNNNNNKLSQQVCVGQFDECSTEFYTHIKTTEILLCLNCCFSFKIVHTVLWSISNQIIDISNLFIL